MVFCVAWIGFLTIISICKSLKRGKCCVNSCGVTMQLAAVFYYRKNEWLIS